MDHKTEEGEGLPTEEELHKQWLDDLKEVIGLPCGAGVRVIRHIIGLGAIYKTTYAGNASTNFLEGRRSLVLELVKDLEEITSREIRADILL